MMARPASLENSLAFHRLNCVDRPSSFGDISVASLENMLRSSATGKFAFFAFVPVLSSRLRAVCPFHLPWGYPDDSRLQWQEMQQKFAAVPVGGWPVWGAAEMSFLPKEVLNVPCGFFFFFFIFFFFGEHASIDLVWHAKDFRKKPFSEIRSLAKAVEFCDRSPCPGAPSALFLASSLQLLY